MCSSRSTVTALTRPRATGWYWGKHGPSLDRRLRSTTTTSGSCSVPTQSFGTDLGTLQARFDREAVMAVGVFAGVPVRDYPSAVKWYELLLGAEASFYPTEVEAVWQLAEDRYVYIVEDQERAGGAVCMIWVDDPVAEAAKIAERGLEPVEIEKYDTVWKYVFHDADGNEIGVGGNVPSGPQAPGTRPVSEAG